jgi:hypothetical protein
MSLLTGCLLSIDRFPSGTMYYVNIINTANFDANASTVDHGNVCTVAGGNTTNHNANVDVNRVGHGISINVDAIHPVDSSDASAGVSVNVAVHLTVVSLDNAVYACDRSALRWYCPQWPCTDRTTAPLVQCIHISLHTRPHGLLIWNCDEEYWAQGTTWYCIAGLNFVAHVGY